MSGALEEKSSIWAFLFFKKFQDNSDVHLDFKKWLQVFLLNGSFDDIEFYYFSVDQSQYNGIKWLVDIVAIVKYVYQFLQSIARQKVKDNCSCKP